MAAGVPVVAAAAGGPAELIVHNVNGVLYPMGDQTALASEMRRMRADPQHRQRLIAAGRASVHDYHPDAVAGRVEQLYREIIETS